MKQYFGLHPFLVSTLALQLVTLFLCQVQGGIITNQQSLTLPKELADSIASASNPVSDSDKNGTRTGRVLYTASYSNVRISSKEPKNLKYFPIPAVISKKHVPSPTVIVPVLRTEATASSTTEEITTTSSTTTTTTTPSPSAAPVEATIPDVIEILEEIEPDSDEGEVVTETVNNGDLNNDDDTDDVAVTEKNVEEE